MNQEKKSKNDFYIYDLKVFKLLLLNSKQNLDMFRYPTLYILDVRKGYREWTICFYRDNKNQGSIITISGLCDGKKVQNISTIIPKGKRNIFEQARQQMHTFFSKKKREGYSENPDCQTNKDKRFFEFMLADDYTSQRIKSQSFIVQPKLEWCKKYVLSFRWTISLQNKRIKRIYASNTF